MLKATVAIGDLLDLIAGGMGLFSPPDRPTLRALLCDCITRLYGEVIRKRAVASTPAAAEIPLAALPHAAGTGPITAADVTGVRVGRTAYRYLPPEVFALRGERTGFYTLQGDALELALIQGGGDTAEVIYTVRPARFGEAEEALPVPLPDEFLPLAAAYVRGQAYKLANEDALSAKWLGEYNLLLEEFAGYLAMTDREKGR